MKNLKKVLSLALALVMAMSLMTTAFAGDTDFTDADEITKTEAVEVMAAIGILEGSNGAFDPQGTLTREQAAKMITYMLLGTTNAEKQPAASAFADVAADRWSASYVAYCASEGIIAGKNATTFAPTDKLTGYQYAKMLLCALGYDATEKGLVGDSWAINTGKYFVAEGLDVEGVDMNAELSRENAAQMTLNAMNWSDTPDTWTVYNNTGTNAADWVGEFEEASDAYTTAALLKATYPNVHVVKTPAADTLMADVYSVAVNDTTAVDAFGRPGVSYTHADWDAALFYADEPVVTYTSAVKGGQVYTDLGKPATLPTFTVKLDNNASAWTNTNIVSGNKTTMENTDNGVLTEIYETAVDNSYVVVQVNTYVGKVTNYTAEELDSNGDVKTEESITVDDLDNTMNWTSAVLETHDFAQADEDDNTVVLYTATTPDGTNYTIQSAVAAEKVTAEVSKIVAGKSITAGAAYDYSANVYVATAGAAAVVEKDADIYLDAYGYAIATGLAAEESVDAVYAYVLNAQAGDTWNSGNKAELVFADGTVKKVDTKNNYISFKDHLVTYTVKDGVYTLSDVDAAATDTALATTKGSTSITLSNDGGISNASKNTVFLVRSVNDTDGNYVFNAYTGYANVPTITADTATKYAVAANADNTKVADFVYIDCSDASNGGTISGSNTSTDLVYVDYDSTVAATTDANGTYYTYNAVVAGKVTTINIATALFSTTLNGTSANFVLDSITVQDGIVTACALATAGGTDYTAATGIVAAKDGLVGFGNDAATANYLAYADDCVVFVSEDDVITADTKLADVDTDANDGIIYTLNDDGLVDVIYIVVNA